MKRSLPIRDDGYSAEDCVSSTTSLRRCFRLRSRDNELETDISSTLGLQDEQRIRYETKAYTHTHAFPLFLSTFLCSWSASQPQPTHCFDSSRNDLLLTRLQVMFSLLNEFTIPVAGPAEGLNVCFTSLRRGVVASRNYW